MKKIFVAAVTALALAGCGAAEGSTSTPVVTVTENVPGAVQTVEKTPQACLQALTYADQGFDLAAAAMTASGDGMLAISNFDMEGADAANDRLTEVNEEMVGLADKYVAAKEKCRELAE